MNDFAGSADAIAEKLVAGGMDPQQAMTLALRMAQSRQQADQSILGGVPTQPPVSDVPPATEILGGDPSRLFQRQPTTMERIKDLPKDVLGAADAMASMGSLVGLAVPSMMYALRPGQKTQGDPMEFALRNMYMPRSERGPSHLAGLGEVLESLPQTGPLPELQAFAGVGRGVGRQLAEKGRQAGRAMAPAAANVAEDILSRQGLLMQAAPSGPTRVEAPASSLGFYDPVHQAALNIQRKQGPGQAFLNELQRSENVNKEFLEASGLAEKLRTTPNITREEVQSLAKGAVPEIKEVVRGENAPVRKMEDELYRMAEAQERAGNSSLFTDEILAGGSSDSIVRMADVHGGPEEMVSLARRINDIFRGGVKPKYASYQLPGGENYREVLLTIPIDREKYARSLVDPAVWSRMTEEQRAEFMNAPIRGGSAGTFKSVHWEEPNVVSHIRMNDRTDAEGKKVLFIEEIQSDWAQEGRKKGFAPKDADAQLKAGEKRMAERGQQIRQLSNRMAALDDTQLDEFNRLATERQRLQDLQAEDTDWGNRLYDAKQGGVASAPFVTNTKEWVDLSLKNIIKRAVDEGYDRVAFVNGTQSADRYDLSKQVESISYQDRGDGTYRIIAAAKDRGVAIPEQTVSRDKLPDVVGQEVAKKIVSGEGKDFPVGSVSEGMRSLSGLDLKVGGEGMKAFYDKLVPERVNAILKRFGGGKATLVPIQVGERGAMVVPHGNQWAVQYEDGGFRPVRTKEEAEKIASTQKAEQIGFDITPAMRERFQKPIPYKQGGSVNHKAVESARRALEKAMGGEVKMGTGGSMLGTVAGKAAGKAGAAAAKQARTVLSPAESEVNKAKFLADSAVQQRMYTGTSKDQDFSKFNVPKNGAWFTPSTDVASAYAKENDSKGLKYDFDTRQYKEVNTADRVMPVYLRATNPYQITDDDIKRMNVGNYKKAQSQFFDSLRSQGHDSVIFDDGTTVVLQGPHQIKSAIGNRGTYDITSPELNKAHGGLAHMSGGGVLGKTAGRAAGKSAKSAKKGGLPQQVLSQAAPVTKINFGQEATRKSINDLIKYMNDTGQPYTSGLLPKETDPSSMLAVLNDLDYYLGMVPPPQYITDANKAKVRELWSNIEKNNAQWFRSDPEHPAVIMRRQMEESMKTPELLGLIASVAPKAFKTYKSVDFPQKEGDVRLYHGGGDPGFEKVPEGGAFDGFFALPDKVGGHGIGHNYFADIPQKKY